MKWLCLIQSHENTEVLEDTNNMLMISVCEYKPHFHLVLFASPASLQHENEDEFYTVSYDQV